MILNVAFEQITADIDVQLDEESMELTVGFDSDDTFETEFGEVVEVMPDDVPAYEGDHEVTPTFETQILDTSGLMLEEDIRIESIPLARVSNTSGGTTVIIGG